MRRSQLVIAGATAILLAALLGWQQHRERLVRACMDAGGVWHGARSQCTPPVRPILRRALDRS